MVNSQNDNFSSRKWLILVPLLLCTFSQKAFAEEEMQYGIELLRSTLVYDDVDPNCFRKKKKSPIGGNCGKNKSNNQVLRLPKSAEITISPDGNDIYQKFFDFDYHLITKPAGNNMAVPKFRELWYRISYRAYIEKTKSYEIGEGWIFAGNYPNANVKFTYKPVTGISATLTSSPIVVNTPAEEEHFWDDPISYTWHLIFPKQAAPILPPSPVTPPGFFPYPIPPTKPDQPTEPPMAQALPPSHIYSSIDWPDIFRHEDPDLPLRRLDPGMEVLGEACNILMSQQNLEHYLKAVIKPLALLNSIKSVDEMDKYLSCFVGDPQQHKNYLSKYKLLINYAAEACDIPVQLLTCLLYRESQQWKPDVMRTVGVTSTAGAMGSAQITPETMIDISKIVSARITTAEREKYEKIVTDWRVKNANAKTPISEINAYAHAKNTLINEQLRLDCWNQYFTAICADPRTGFKKQKDGTCIPNSFNGQAYNPTYAFGAAGLWLRYIMINLDSNLIEKKKSPITQDMEGHYLPDFLAIVGGIYNRGMGALISLEKVNPPSVSGWKKAVANIPNQETKNHMESLRRCMEKGNGKPPVWIGCRPNEKGQSVCGEITKNCWPDPKNKRKWLCKDIECKL